MQTQLRIAAIFSVLASLFIAYSELGVPVDIGRLLLLSGCVLSGPLCAPFTMLLERSVGLDSVVFVAVVAVLAALPLGIAVRRKNPLLLAFGAILWVWVGWFWAIGIYI